MIALHVPTLRLGDFFHFWAASFSVQICQLVIVQTIASLLNTVKTTSL